MLPLERDGLSAEEVKRILHASDRKIDFEYRLLDRNDNFKAILNSVMSCRVDYKSLSSLKLSANIQIKEEEELSYGVMPAALNFAESGEDFEEGELDGVVVGDDGLELDSKYALNFDGDNDYVSLPLVSAIDVGADFTVEMIIKANSLSGIMVLIAQTKSTYNRFAIQISDGEIKCSIWDGSFKAKASSDENIDTNIYYHIAYVKASSTGSLYINGILQAGTNNAFTHNQLVCNVARRGDGNYYYNGVIDELRIWSIARTQQQIQNSMNKRLVGTEDGLAGYWPMNEGSDNTVYDNSVSSNNGTIYSATWTTGLLYPEQGYRLSLPLDLSSVGTVKTSEISWQATEPTDTSLKVETSLSTDSGETWGAWQQATNGGSIPGIVADMDLSNAKLKTRATLSTTDTSVTPVIESLSISLTGEKERIITIDYLNDRLQPVIKFQSREITVNFPLGILLLNSPTRKDRKNAVYREIECYSKLQILQEDKFGERYFISAGTNYTTAISQIITSAGETKINIVPSSATLQTDKEYDIEMSKLQIVNELLNEINYNSLRVDVNGYFVSEPYVLPVDREIEYEYIDNELSVIVPEVMEALDLFNVPNVFVRYLNNPERPPLRSVYTNDNPDSITSTVSRGRNIVDIRPVEDIASQEALDEMARRDAFNASQVYGHVEFETAIMPFHDYLNCLFLRYRPLGIEDKYIETSWSIECRAGGRMQHTVRKVVNI